MLSRRRFDVDDVHRMVRADVLHEDDRIELIEGEIVEMSAVGARHAACVVELTHSLVSAVGPSMRVSVQNPLRLDRWTEPEPDVAVLRSRPEGYAAAHPGADDVLLVIEVADSSLRFDRDVKLPLYAAAGVPELWIIDLRRDCVEVHRRPAEGAFTESGTVADGTLRPVKIPDIELQPSDILPPRPD